MQLHYCDQTCQKSHWRWHKLFCRPMPVPATSNVPDIEEIGLRNWSRDADINSPQCSCEICARECTLIPAAFSPYQILRDFEIKGNGIFDTMVEDYRVVGKTIFPYLRPAIVDEKGMGQRTDSVQTGKCVHLGPNGCTLSRKDMPTGCAVAHPCVSRGEMTTEKAHMHMMWLTQDARTAITLFETYQKAKNPQFSVGFKDVTFFNSVRKHRIVKMIYTNKAKETKVEDDAVRNEMRLLGPNTIPEIESTLLALRVTTKLAKI